MSRVAIISSVYGGYDTPEHVAQTTDVDHIMVTDGQTPVPDGWRTVIEQRPHMHPRLAAKHAKCLPFEYTDAEITIWVDASFTLAPAFAAWASAQLGAADIAQIVHPNRDSIIDEAEVSAGMTKYSAQPVREQASHYVTGGHPADWGLWATGLIVRRNTVANRTLGLRWLAEQIRWTYQDQISQPVVLRQVGIRPTPIDGPLRGSRYFGMKLHRDDQ